MLSKKMVNTLSLWLLGVGFVILYLGSVSANIVVSLIGLLGMITVAYLALQK
jgi:hypothetical protein